MENFDIRAEEKFINLLGYNVVGPNNSNRWIITDSDENEVGFIQYKKIVKKNKGKNLDAIYGYQMEINTADISFNRIRKLNNGNSSDLHDDGFRYDFDYKKDGINHHMELNMGPDYPGFELWYDNKYVSFTVDFEGLHVDFDSKTENYNVNETISAKLQNYNLYGDDCSKSYWYTLSFCPKDEPLDSSKNGSTFELEVYEDMGSLGHLLITNRIWKNEKLTKTYSSLVEGDMYEAIKKHKMGLDSFNHFRYLINNVTPFNKDLIISMLEERGLKEDILTLFIPDFNKTEDNPQLQLVNQDEK